ncbi:DEAD/DEAH box helicase [Bradyrhizobium sp.]|nr:DEAD/DEAH box helicase [Bradyrhizobium sp.]
MLSKTSFHPSVVAWFEEQFGVPTPPQAEAWPLIKAGQNVLIAAPTGSGKTLAAFLSAIDDLVWQGEAGALKDETQVVYVSPLKALSTILRRRSPASETSCANKSVPIWRSEAGCGPATRPQPSASAWHGARRTSS